MDTISAWNPQTVVTWLKGEQQVGESFSLCFTGWVCCVWLCERELCVSGCEISMDATPNPEVGGETWGEIATVFGK